MDWPSTLVADHRTDDLTESTAPAELMRGTLRDGQWALVRVREGSLRLIDHQEAREGELNPEVPGFLEPGVEYELVADAAVVFYVEYYRDASAEPEDA